MNPRPITCPKCGRIVGIMAKKPMFPVNLACLCGTLIPIGAGLPGPQPPKEQAKTSNKKKGGGSRGGKRKG